MASSSSSVSTPLSSSSSTRLLKLSELDVENTEDALIPADETEEENDDGRSVEEAEAVALLDSASRDPHQVAGHGDLLRSHNLVFKPGLPTEVQFYETARDIISPELLEFLPGYDGTVEREEGGEVRKYIALENITAGYRHPCVMDIKLGTRQHLDTMSASKIEESIAKCKSSTSSALSLRVCGMKVYKPEIHSYHFYGKYWGRHVTVEQFPLVVDEFVRWSVTEQERATLGLEEKERGSCDSTAIMVEKGKAGWTPNARPSKSELTEKRAQMSSSGQRGVVGLHYEVAAFFAQRLRRLLYVLKTMKRTHSFVSSSILFVYDGDLKRIPKNNLSDGVDGKSQYADIRLIDFGQTFAISDKRPYVESNIQLGVENLIKYFDDIVSHYSEESSNNKV